MGILLFELFRNPLFMGILNKWETLVKLHTALLRHVQAINLLGLLRELRCHVGYSWANPNSHSFGFPI